MNINETDKNDNVLSKVTRMQIIVTTFVIIIIIAISILAWFGNSKFNKLSKNIDDLSSHISILENRFSSTTEELKTNISQNSNTLTNAINQQQQNVGNLQQQVGNYQQQVGTVSSTVSNLQKLSKTDPQLLAKYSKVFFLSENYAPARITEIPNQYAYSDKKISKFQSQAWPYLQKMIDDANKASTPLYVFSAYRPFEEQQALKGDYKVTYGAGTANSFSADQGYSEHQLGTALDLIAPGLGGNLDGFENTTEYQWLLANAYKYGFILSYPKNNKFYVFEPWHWRFVGVKLATDLHNQNKSFYEMDQRDIDEYLINLFD